MNGGSGCQQIGDLQETVVTDQRAQGRHDMGQTAVVGGLQRDVHGAIGGSRVDPLVGAAGGQRVAQQGQQDREGGGIDDQFGQAGHLPRGQLLAGGGKLGPLRGKLTGQRLALRGAVDDACSPRFAVAGGATKPRTDVYRWRVGPWSG